MSFGDEQLGSYQPSNRAGREAMPIPTLRREVKLRNGRRGRCTGRAEETCASWRSAPLRLRLLRIDASSNQRSTNALRYPRRTIAVALLMQLCGCFCATDQVLLIGKRVEKGTIHSADQVMKVDDQLIMTGTVETYSGGHSDCANVHVTEGRLIERHPDRHWWVVVPQEDFFQRMWWAPSLVASETPPPADVLARARPASEACIIAVPRKHLLEFESCGASPKPLSMTSNADFVLRQYRAWWSYPAVAVGIPVALVVDILTFPIQAYLIHRSGALSRW